MTAPMILVVSDELEIQQGFASALGFCGLAPVLASTVHEAISILNRHPISLVFSSDQMPEDEFEDLICQPWRRTDKIPVVVFSELDDWRRYLDFLYRGAFDYVLLPLSPGEIERVVRNTLGLRTSEMICNMGNTLMLAECADTPSSIRQA
jgi:DNA-binding NtrC family response regulator